MKKLITFFSICTTVAILALPVAARNLVAQPNNAVAQDACAPEAKDALYESFRKNRPTDQAKAYEDAKKYLACPAGQVTEAQQKIIDYLKKWVTAYETEFRKIRFTQLLYNEMKYPEAFALGKEILAAEPENLKVMIDLGANGYLVAGNASLASESLNYATKSLQLLDSGKTVEDWQPLAGKDVAVAYLNYTIGSLTLENDPGAALKYLLKAAQFETPLKKSPFTYAYIAGAYETGPYAKQEKAYKEMYSGKDETPESKLALANIHQLVDRMIDGYARAVALAGSDTKFAARKPVWNESLTSLYKFRTGSEDKLPELIATILSKPLPPEPTPLTSLPVSTPAATPAATSGASGTNGTASAATPAGTAPAGAKPPTVPPASGTKTPAAKPDRPRNRR